MYGLAVQAVPLGAVDRRRPHAHQHLVVGRLGLLELPQLEHVRPAVPLPHDGLHRGCLPFTVRTTLPVFCRVSTYRVASTTSSSGYVRSITGR